MKKVYTKIGKSIFLLFLVCVFFSLIPSTVTVSANKIDLSSLVLRYHAGGVTDEAKIYDTLSYSYAYPAQVMGVFETREVMVWDLGSVDEYHIEAKIGLGTFVGTGNISILTSTDDVSYSLWIYEDTNGDTVTADDNITCRYIKWQAYNDNAAPLNAANFKLFNLEAFYDYANCSSCEGRWISENEATLYPTNEWQTVNGSLGNSSDSNRYVFNATTLGTYIFSTCAEDGGCRSFYTAMCLFDDTYTLLDDSDWCIDEGHRIIYTITVPGIYYIQVTGLYGEYGTYTLAYLGSYFDTYSIYGYVTDADTCDALEDVKLNVSSNITYTDDMGFYTLDGFVAGTYTLHAYKFGYKSDDSIVTILNTSKEVNITLDSWLADPSTSNITVLDESGYDEMYPALMEFNYTASIYAIAAPFVAIMGNFFFLILFGTPFIMAWIRQANIIIPVTLGFTVGGLLVVLLPIEYQGVALILLILGFVGVMFGLFKERF